MNTIYRQRKGDSIIDVTEDMKTDIMSSEFLSDEEIILIIGQLLQILTDPSVSRQQVRDWLFMTTLIFEYEGNLNFTSKDPQSILHVMNDLVAGLRALSQRKATKGGHLYG